MSSNSNTFNLYHGFEIFLGFLYSVLVGLILQAAYLKSKFNSVEAMFLTFLLVLFLAFDWLSRTQGFLKMPETLLKKTGPKNLLKIFLDLAVVYFLLVFSLKFVDAYFNSTRDDFLFYSMAIFATLSGLWNSLLISIFTGLNKPHIITLLRGHLHQDIIEMFPDLIKKWRVEIELKFTHIHMKMKELKDNASFESETMEEYLKQWGKLKRQRNLLYVKCLSWKLYRLILPYFFVFHVIALNFVLGFYIWLITFNGGRNLFSELSLIQASSWHLLGIAFGVLLSSVSLTLHFRSSKNREGTFKERIGCWILFLTTIYAYSLCSPAVLVFLVIVQQVMANIIMNVYFKPSPNTTEKPSPVLEEEIPANT